MFSATCIAPVNIAVIKYWGKRDKDLILPVNSSLSVTLDLNELRAKTTVTISPDFKEDQLWLNGKKQLLSAGRYQRVLQEVRRLASKRKSGEDNSAEKASWKVHTCSENNFPTAAGLASSAAGYACLATALSKVYGVGGDFSRIARLGSGSACRSVHGGFVLWDKGCHDDGSDSVSRPIRSESHWPELRVLILVVSDQTKHTSSTDGMQASVDTSSLLTRRLETIPDKEAKITQAIINRDFQTFAEITMMDSNQFHAICLDTYPPISYLTDVSRQIIRLVHLYNTHYSSNKVAYTFDAGPNACLFLLEEDVPEFLHLISHYFKSDKNDNGTFVRGADIPPGQVETSLQDFPMQQNLGAVKYVIYTKPGPGPRVLTDPEDSLLNHDGLPKFSMSK